MKTKITVDSNNVTVERDDPITGERETTVYFAPHNGGYVRIRDSAQRFPQVCDGLQSTGNALSVSSAVELAAVIRRELRRCVSIERRVLGE